MAIDEKFITAGISSETISQMNRKRSKRKSRPKPWDRGPKSSEGSQDDSPALKSGSDRPVSASKKEAIDHADRAQQVDRGKPRSSLDGFSSPLADQAKKSLPTVREQYANFKDTEDEQYTNSNGSESKHYDNCPQTEQEQNKNNKGAVAEQQTNSSVTVGAQKTNGTNTVREQLGVGTSTHPEQLDNSSRTARSQYENSTGTIQKQSNDGKSTVSKQYEYVSPTDDEHSVNSQPNLPPIVREQFAYTENKGTLSLEESLNILKTLSGTRWVVIEYLCNECLKNSINILPQVSYTFLANTLGRKKESLRTIIARIKKLGLFQIDSKIKGPGSTVDIIVFESTIKAFSKLMVERSSYSKISEQYTYSTAISKQTELSSSSRENLKKEKTTSNEGYILPTDFESIEIPANMKECRFGRPQIIQIAKKGIVSADQLQESLDHFSIDLEAGRVKAERGPLMYFMGILNKQCVPYVSEEYLAQLREIREKRLKDMEELRELKKLALEKSLVDKFEKYKKGLSQEDINKIVPPNEFIKEGSRFQELALKEKFENGELE